VKRVQHTIHHNTTCTSKYTTHTGRVIRSHALTPRRSVLLCDPTGTTSRCCWPVNVLRGHRSCLPKVGGCVEQECWTALCQCVSKGVGVSLFFPSFPSSEMQCTHALPFLSSVHVDRCVARCTVGWEGGLRCVDPPDSMLKCSVGVSRMSLLFSCLPPSPLFLLPLRLTRIFFFFSCVVCSLDGGWDWGMPECMYARVCGAWLLLVESVVQISNVHHTC
jgi:hypothetical protein